jgi:hypothetical protein
MSSGTAERGDLHARVRAFIEASAAGRLPAESFDALGLAIARFQAHSEPPYARLLSARGIGVERASCVAELPAVPTDAFRMTRVAAHGPELDRAVFRTSGTTAALRGVHALSTTATYETAAVAWGRHCLFPDAPRPLLAILLIPNDPESSLSAMAAMFARVLFSDARWVIDGGLDVEGLARACDVGERPAVVLGTSFAFVHALDALGGRRLPLPRASRVMHTGGHKGRSRAVEPGELRRAIAGAFGVEAGLVVGEYGMTELSSQMYEGTVRAHFGLATASARHGVFMAPPWLRVTAVDPETLVALPFGRAGILRFEDLANVDSAVAIQTADCGRVTDAGVELLGRAPGAPPRGCSLAIDELLGGEQP